MSFKKIANFLGWLGLGNISSEGDSPAKLQTFSHPANILMKKVLFSFVQTKFPYICPRQNNPKV